MNEDGMRATCDYDENGTDAVADFSSMDPEGAGINWSTGGTDGDLSRPRAAL